MAKRGFTIVEVLVSITMVGLAVAGLAAAIGHVGRANARAANSETMIRLCEEKVREIIATNDFNTLSGDFQDRELPYSWEAQLDTTSVENLERLSVTVTYTGIGRESSQTLYTLVHRTEGS